MPSQLEILASGPNLHPYKWIDAVPLCEAQKVSQEPVNPGQVQEKALTICSGLGQMT